MPNEDESLTASLRLVRHYASASAMPAVRPVLSIVVCAYRHAQYIEQCLSSIDCAMSNEVELVVIDDGSPDDTLQRCIDFSFRSIRETRIYTKPNQGLIHSLRVGLELAQGQYIAFMASDDFYEEGGIDDFLKAIEALNSKPQAVLCQATFLGMQADGKPVYGEALKRFFDGQPQDRVRAICTDFPKPMLLQATVFNTEFLRSLKPWRDGLELDDWPMFIRLFLAEAEQGATVLYLPSLKLSRYRLHEGGIHNNYERQLRITEQVAKQLVPAVYRAVCLANLRLDWGLLHLREGRFKYGARLCLSGLRASVSWCVIRRLLMRLQKPAASMIRAMVFRRS